MATLRRQAQRLDLEIDKGSSFEWAVEYREGSIPQGHAHYEPDDLTLVPVDGKVIIGTITPSVCPTDTPIPSIEFSTTNGMITTDPASDGLIQINFLSSVNTLWDWKTAKYSLIIQEGAGDDFMLLYGTISMYDANEG